ncbi:proteolysis tag for 10Sa_RNA, partial [Campylobacter jejuni subsp. jejuni NCTC 11168-BN148]
ANNVKFAPAYAKAA